MNPRRRKYKKRIIVTSVILVVVFLALVGGFGVHCFNVYNFNSKIRHCGLSYESENVTVDIHRRGLDTDSWTKNDITGPDDMYNGNIYEATITNNTGVPMSDWTLRMIMSQDCYLNNAWCGKVEIHQYDGIKDVTQTIDLRSPAGEDIILETAENADLLIKLKYRDYLIYHPDEASGEFPVDSTKDEAGSVSIGLIFYSLTDDTDLSDYCLDYQLHKDYFSLPEAWPYIAVFSAWALATILFVVAAIFVTMYEKKLEKSDRTTRDTLDVFSNFVDAKDPYTKGHSGRVAEYSRLIAKKMGLSGEKCKNIYYVSLLHDIGKCYIPDEILKKPSRLTQEEFEVVKSHTVKGKEMLESFRSLPELADGVLYHHEKYNGDGYPTGKAGDNIPLIARIICVADSFDAMNSNRVYRNALPRERIIEELKKCSGTQFDPEVVEAFLKVLDENDSI